jgi:hypothetical protein
VEVVVSAIEFSFGSGARRRPPTGSERPAACTDEPG